MTLNLSPISAGEAAAVLREGWRAQMEGGLAMSWMLHGRPGVGKTQIIQQMADDLGARLFDLRLTTIEPQDLRGLPYYDHDVKKTVWYRPEDLPDDPANPAILFLDELTAASPYLQPTVYGLLQERRVGRHVLPPNVFIAAAGNTVEDGAVAYEMGAALADRLVHLHVVADAGDWLESYAGPKGLHPAVTTFLRARPDLLDTTEDSLRNGALVACTPRSWERASDIMRTVRDRRPRAAMIAGVLGAAVAADFAAIAEEIETTVAIEDLLSARDADRDALFPDTLNGLNAVVFGLVGAANADAADGVITAMERIRGLAERRGGAFARLPLAELSALGFEMLMTKALRDGFADAFARSDAYARYAADRRAAGVA